jgi:hypothetical protein
MEGIGVREMGSPGSPGWLFPRRIATTATEQGLTWRHVQSGHVMDPREHHSGWRGRSNTSTPPPSTQMRSLTSTCREILELNMTYNKCELPECILGNSESIFTVMTRERTKTRSVLLRWWILGLVCWLVKVVCVYVCLCMLNFTIWLWVDEVCMISILVEQRMFPISVWLILAICLMNIVWIHVLCLFIFLNVYNLF